MIEPDFPVEYVRGRSCDGCTICCKVMEIQEVETPKDEWCVHCNKRSGCKIYSDRPLSCQNFHCGYLTWDQIPDYWQPSKCKMVIVSELEGNRVAFHVDKSWPNAWRQEPFYSEIKALAWQAARDCKQIVVCVGKRAIIILPHEDVDLGIMEDDDRIITYEVSAADGPVWKALKLKVDDPRIAGLEDGKQYRASDLR